MLTDILAAVALLLVFEGIMPFLNPDKFRKTLLMAIQMDDKTLRLIGLASMTVGVAMLYATR